MGHFPAWYWSVLCDPSRGSSRICARNGLETLLEQDKKEPVQPSNTDQTQDKLIKHTT
ncbi:hypothetical protein J3F83DRAFT_730721 [Trichoderma novae-zelandiae]